jgi:hypothetical protein
MLRSILDYDRNWPSQMLAYLATKDGVPQVPALPAKPRDEHDRDLIDLWLFAHASSFV